MEFLLPEKKTAHSRPKLFFRGFPNSRWREASACLGLLLLGSVPAGAQSVNPPPEAFTHVATNTAGETATVQFLRHSVRGDNFTILIPTAGDGSPWTVQRPQPVRTYLGTVEGHPGAVAAGLIRGDGRILTRISFENGVEWTSTGGTSGIRGSDNWARAWPTTVVGAGGAGSRVYGAETGIDLTYRHFVAAGSTVDRAVEMAEFAVMATNAIFLRDAAILHRIGRVVVRTDPELDPYEQHGGSTSGLLPELRTQWNAAGSPMGSSHQVALVARPNTGGGLAYVGTIGTNNRYSANGTDSNGDFTVIWRHEVGHNWGSSHYEGGGRPEGPTIMSDNQLSRFSSSELVKIIGHRNTKLSILEDIGPYPFPLPPRANMDRGTFLVGESSLLDVLANDSDSTGQALTLLSADSMTRQGGEVLFSPGTGPGGRDQLHYHPPESLVAGTDYFSYRIRNTAGLTATGHVALRPLFNESLVAHWPLEATEGTTADDTTPSRRHGTLSGGASWTSPGLVGAGALLLAGNNSQVSIPALDITTNTFTITGWIRRDGDQPGFAGIAFGRMNTSGAGLNFRDGTHELGFHWGSGDNPSWRFSSGLIVPDNTWTFCALVISPTEANLYLKPAGGTVQTATASGTFGAINFSAPFFLGSDPNHTSRRFRGQMDDFRIFQRSLRAMEIAALAQGQGTVSDPQPALSSRPQRQPQTLLSWTPPPSATAFRVFGGDSYTAVRDATPNSPEFLGAVSSPSFSWSESEPASDSGLRFWRVDAGDGDLYFAGPVWFFTLEDGVASISNNPWNVAATWSHGQPAPTTGRQGTGERYIIVGNAVSSNDPSSNSQTWIGQSVAVRDGGVLDLARLHAQTGQSVSYNLPPILLQHEGVLQFRASTGTSHHQIATPITVNGSATWRMRGGSYGQTATLSGPIQGEGRIAVDSDTNSPQISGDVRQFSVTSADNSFTGDWSVAHTAAGDDFASLRAQAAGALGTGTVRLGVRSLLEASASGGLDSVAGVTLAGAASELRLNVPWRQPAADLTLESGSPVVSLSASPSEIGNLEGAVGIIRPLGPSASLRINQTRNAVYNGTWSGPITLEKHGAARLELQGGTGGQMGLSLAEGALALSPATTSLTELHLSGGMLSLAAVNLASPVLAVSGPITRGQGLIRLDLTEIPTNTQPRILLTYTGTLTGQPPVAVFDGDGNQVAAEVDYGSGSNSLIFLRFNTGNVEAATLTVQANPPEGGSVTGSGAFFPGALAPITATASPNWRFVDWTGVGVTAPEAEATQVLIESSQTVEANFEPVERALHILIEGGADGSILATPDLPVYRHGDSVVLRPDPAQAYRFAGWFAPEASLVDEITVVLTEDTTVRALFHPAPAQLPETFFFETQQPSGRELLLAQADFEGLAGTGLAEVQPSPANDFAWTLLTPTGNTLEWTADPAGIDSGQALRLQHQGSVSFRGLLGQLPASALLQTGDTLTFGFEGRYLQMPTDNGGGLRFGITTAARPDQAFFAQLGTGTTTDFALRRDLPQDNSPGAGSTQLLAFQTTGKAHAALRSEAFRASFSITRLASGYQIRASVNGAVRTATSTEGWDSFDAIFVRNGGVSADFVIDNPKVTLTKGERPWIAAPTTEESVPFSHALRSGNIAPDSTSWIETTVTGPGILRFYHRVSSEFARDFFRLYRDGIPILQRSGESDWQLAEFELGPGNQVLRWEVVKDEARDGGTDAAWVADPTFQPLGNPFELWIAQTSVPPERRTPHDRNGPMDWPNLLAYALGVDPMKTTPADGPRLTPGNEAVETIRLIFNRAESSPGVVLVVRASPDLESWGDANILSESTGEAAHGRTQVEVTVLPPRPDQSFFRLQAHESTPQVP